MPKRFTPLFSIVAHLCTSELELLHHPNTEARLTIFLPTHISRRSSGLSPTRKEQILSLLQTDTSKIDTLIRIYGYLLDGLYNMQNQRAVHQYLVTICDLLDTPKPPSQYQVDEFCYAITLILLNYSILQRVIASRASKRPHKSSFSNESKKDNLLEIVLFYMTRGRLEEFTQHIIFFNGDTTLMGVVNPHGRL